MRYHPETLGVLYMYDCIDVVVSHVCRYMYMYISLSHACPCINLVIITAWIVYS